MSIDQRALADTLTIRPWPDPVIDVLGHDPRSQYVESYWLSVLGPSSVWFLRWAAAHLEARPEGFGVEVSDLARALGLGSNTQTRNSPIRRTLDRCCDFDVARLAGSGEMHVRRKLAPLTRRQVERMPESLQVAHRRWQEEQLAERGVVT